MFASEFKVFMDSGVLALTGSTNSVKLNSVGVADADLTLNIMAESSKRLKDDARFNAISFEGITPADAIRDLEEFQSLYFNPISISSFSKAGGLFGIYRGDLRLSF